MRRHSLIDWDLNNAGIDQLILNVQRSSYRGVLGINIGKNADTPLTHAVDDYLSCMTKAYPFASYIAINISSPNTQQLRQLQHPDALGGLLHALRQAQQRLADTHGRYVPIAVKIAPDLDLESISALARIIRIHRVDAVIATNTTVSRVGVASKWALEAGGLSGTPLRTRSTQVVRELVPLLEDIPVIGVGGIGSARDALEKLDAGAGLIQLYTGFIYQGPALISEIIAATTRIAP